MFTKVSINKLIMFALMTFKEIENLYHSALSKIYSSGETIAITNIAIEFYTKFDKVDSISNKNLLLNEQIVVELKSCLEKLLTQMPIQQIIGECWFYNLKFCVNEHVLVPRSETEELVFEAVQYLKKENYKNVIDIGTGSGCIPISLKKNVENVLIDAIDISSEALTIAKKNAALNNVEINFIELDFLDEKNHDKLKQYDLIISNPPYIPADEKLDKNVLDFEPHLALFVPVNDVLIFYKKILLFAENHLAEKGIIMLELHENYAKQTAQLFLDKNYLAEIKLDMQGKERMLLVSK